MSRSKASSRLKQAQTLAQHTTRARDTHDPFMLLVAMHKHLGTRTWEKRTVCADVTTRHHRALQI